MRLKELNLLLEDMRGEYWIDENGSAWAADGDIGDQNHEAVVIERVMHEIAGMFGVNLSEQTDEDEMYKKIRMALGRRMNQDQKERWDMDGDWQGVMEEMLPPNVDRKNFGKMMDVMNGNMDARDYGKQFYGWIRLKGPDIDLWQISSSAMKRMASGIWDAFQLQPEDGDPHFNIEVMFPRHQYFTGIPLSVIESGRVGELMHYKER